MFQWVGRQVRKNIFDKCGDEEYSGLISFPQNLFTVYVA